jgi:hypothetical protein
MGCITRATLAAGCSLFYIAQSFAAAPQAPTLAGATPAFSFDTVLGKKLLSVDGSMVTLTAQEGTLVRETNAANGALKKTSFNFITDQLGTVLDLADPTKPLGVFRIGKRDAIIQYADGGSETMFVSPEGGLLMQIRTPQQAETCAAWYPEGHVFSMEERKEAVAQYATRLGLAEGVPRKSSTACGIRTDSAATQETDKKPLALAGSAETVAAAAIGVPLLATSPGAPAFSSALAAAQTKRSTESDATNAVEAANLANSPPGVVMLPQSANAATPDQLAQLRRARDGIVVAPVAASRCLSVESERGYRGFRNYCAYPVQYAYCVVGRMLGPDSCQYGAVLGSTDPWGFSALGDSPLTAGRMPIELRWIGCRGRTGDVLPRLEKLDPPTGHCVAVAR